MRDSPAMGERFTVGLDSNGRPFEMTAAEVLVAVEWQTGEANWLTREAEAGRSLKRPRQRGRRPQTGRRST
jgi:hypothetical protein